MKLNLSNMKGKMSRLEMKNVMAGSGGGWSTNKFSMCCLEGESNCGPCTRGLSFCPSGYQLYDCGCC